MSDTIKVSRELLPCPFCASADIDNLTINPALAARYRRYMMLCRSCGCCSDKHKTKKEARMHWNTRAKPAEQQKCQCSMSISVLGDGCRYCQPQEYIDRLHDQIEDDAAEQQEKSA